MRSEIGLTAVIARIMNFWYYEKRITTLAFTSSRAETAQAIF
jgi:hypothetical protein